MIESCPYIASGLPEVERTYDRSLKRFLEVYG